MKTPTGNRLHIGIYGRRNAGKSTLINALTNQQIAIVSGIPGTTADPVYKSMELRPIGPVVFIDTAGYDDEGELGRLRVKKTEATLAKVDIAILVSYGKENADDLVWQKKFEDRDIPFTTYDSRQIEGSEKEASIKKLREEIATLAEVKASDKNEIIDRFVEPGSLVLLVMPQDISAPKDRLILPQVQTLRQLLDHSCTVMTVTAGELENAFKSLARDPDLIITDSQCFSQVYNVKPEGSALTSFSVLYASYKGNVETFRKGAETLEKIAKLSTVRVTRILIAEACTHVPTGEDIGTVKIPKGLKRFIEEKAGKAAAENLETVNVRGSEFPNNEELKEYDLVIHCGACMFNRRHVLSRIAQCETAGVPISNYGIVLAKMAGILNKIMI